MEIEYFRQTFLGCEEIEYFSKAFPECGEIEYFQGSEKNVVKHPYIMLIVTC